MKNDRVVYTVLTGGYDAFPTHDYIRQGYDYICFTNDHPDGAKVGIWTIRNIAFDTKDNQLLSRVPKLLPHKVLTEYEVSLYADANINIRGPRVFENIESLLADGVKYAGVKHQFRDCVYEESLYCYLTGKWKKWRIMRRQLGKYKHEGFPAKFGLYENNFIMRRHNDPEIVGLSEMWWNEFRDNCRRDQFSLTYSYWRAGLPINYLLPPDQWTRNCDDITCDIHENMRRRNRVHNAWCKFAVPVIMRLYFPIYKKSL